MVFKPIIKFNAGSLNCAMLRLIGLIVQVPVEIHYQGSALVSHYSTL